MYTYINICVYIYIYIYIYTRVCAPPGLLLVGDRHVQPGTRSLYTIPTCNKITYTMLY